MKRNIKKIICLLCLAATLFQCAVPAFADEPPAENPVVSDAPQTENKKPLYLKELMFAVDSSYNRCGVRYIYPSGCECYPFDILQDQKADIASSSSEDYYCLIGYSVTDNPALAITDIRCITYSAEEKEEQRELMTVSLGGINYMATPTCYENEEAIGFSGVGGIPWKDSILSTVWDALGEVTGKAFSITLKTIYEWFTPMGIISSLWDAVTDKYVNGFTMYYTKNSAAGEPILADFLINHEAEAEGYTDCVKEFCSVTPYDLTETREGEPVYMHFNRATATEESGGEYLGELRCVYEFPRDMNSTVRKNAEEEFKKTGYEFLDGSNYTLAYKTTNDPKQAITSVKIADTYGGDTWDEDYTMRTYNSPKGTYISAKSFRYVYADAYKALVKGGWIGGSDEAVYVTTSRSAGEPIRIGDLKFIDSIDDIPEGYTAPQSFMLSLGEQKYKGVYIAYPGEKETAGKYISSVSVGLETNIAYNFDKNIILSQLGLVGCNDYIDTNICNSEGEIFDDTEGMYIGYATTDDDESALTGIIIVEDCDKKTFIHNNIVYRRASETDLNKNVSGTPTRQLYYTTSPYAGDPITSLFIDTSLHIEWDDPVLTAVAPDTKTVELRYNTGRYLHYLTDTDTDGEIYLSSVCVGKSEYEWDSDVLGEKVGYELAGENMYNYAAGKIINELDCTKLLRLKWDRFTNGFRYIRVDSVMLGFNVTQSPREAIRGLITSATKSDTLEKDGVTYHLSDGDPLQGPVYGDGGEQYIYLYYTKDKAAGEPVTADIELQASPISYDKEYKPIGVYDTSVDTVPWFVEELNSPALYLYIRCTAQKYVSAISNAESTYDLSQAGMTHALDYNFSYNSEEEGHTYIGYTMTDDSEEALTGLVTVHNGDALPTIIYNECAYYLCGDGRDLNKGVGGDYIYLYYTKDEKAGAPITDLRGFDGDGDIPGGWFVVQREDGGNSNFNAGVESDDCDGYNAGYLLFRREGGDNGFTASVFGKSASPVVIISIALLIMFAGAAVIIVGRKRKEGGKEK